RVPAVQVSLPRRRTFANEIDVLRRVKRFDLFARRGTRACAKHATVEAGFVQLAHERFVAIRAERVSIAETIASDFVARHQQNGRASGLDVVNRGASSPRKRPVRKRASSRLKNTW